MKTWVVAEYDGLYEFWEVLRTTDYEEAVLKCNACNESIGKHYWGFKVYSDEIYEKTVAILKYRRERGLR